MACRETNSLWFYIRREPLYLFFGYDKWIKKWKIPYIFKLIRTPNFLHDTFGKFFNRWVKCPLFGHKNIQKVGSCENDTLIDYCFDCEQCIKRRNKCHR